MSDTLITTIDSVQTEASAAAASTQAKPAKTKNRFETVQPVLEKLFELYPQLFGAKFLPLKLGIFQDLLAANPQAFQRDTLKAALGVHARSTRYLQCVASGLARHDLAGLAVEPVAPEHLFLAIVELFQRRQARQTEDLRPKLQAQLTAAYEQSGLSRQDYLARIGAPSEAVQAVLDEAMASIDQQRARHAALKKSLEASGKSAQEFADMLGMALTDLERALQA
jgi:sRNA-binding protein